MMLLTSRNMKGNVSLLRTVYRYGMKSLPTHHKDLSQVLIYLLYTFYKYIFVVFGDISV